MNGNNAAPKIRVVAILALILHGVMADGGAAGKEKVLLRITDNELRCGALLRKVVIEAPGSLMGYGTKLEWEYAGHKSASTWNGFTARPEGNHQATIVFMARIGQPPIGGYPPMLSFSAEQQTTGGGAACSSVTAPAEKSATLSNIVRLTIEPGEYEVDSPVKLGFLGSHPILLKITRPGASE